MFFCFFNDTATTEIYTSFPTRRSSDLVCVCVCVCVFRMYVIIYISLRNKLCIVVNVNITCKDRYLRFDNVKIVISCCIVSELCVIKSKCL